MQTLVEQSSDQTNRADYNLVAEAITFLESNYQKQPTLEEVAAHLHLSPFYLQRLFTRWAGVSPKRFVQYLTASHAKALLAKAHSVLDATYESGLSSPGRLHDLLIATEAVSPGEFKSQGSGITITYGRQTTPFGDALIATTDRGICALSFLDDEIPARNWQSAVNDLQNHWQAATLVEDQGRVSRLVEGAFDQWQQNGATTIQLLLKGTNFQLKVWDALLRIPTGAAWSYEDVAAAIGQPSASRAVGNAVGANPIGYLIPCHRVIRKSGVIEGYHWGATRKKAMLAWETAKEEGSRQAA